MPKPFWFAALALSGCMLLIANSVPADNTEQENTLKNTQINLRDQDNATLTAEDQKESEPDLKITAQIRKAILQAEWLSTDAYNAKVITRNGVVTLRGPVESPSESSKLQNISLKTAGVLRVENQLETKAP